MQIGMDSYSTQIGSFHNDCNNFCVAYFVILIGKTNASEF